MDLAADVDGVEQEVATGALPGWEQVERLVHTAHARCRAHDGGQVADYIPVLAEVDPELFGVVVAESGGEVHAVGDADVEFSVQSISKAFVYALVCEAYGHQGVVLLSPPTYAGESSSLLVCPSQDEDQSPSKDPG